MCEVVCVGVTFPKGMLKMCVFVRFALMFADKFVSHVWVLWSKPLLHKRLLLSVRGGEGGGGWLVLSDRGLSRYTLMY